jgi:hypothetical protein
VALIYPANVVRDVERRWKRRSQRPVAALPHNDDSADMNGVRMATDHGRAEYWATTSVLLS